MADSPAPTPRPWEVIGHSNSLYVSRCDNGPAYRAFDGEEAHGLKDALNERDALVATVEDLTARLAHTTPPTAGEILAHIDAGGTIERWHPWSGGGGWGCPHTADEYAWRTCPPREPQPGFRLAARAAQPQDGT